MQLLFFKQCLDKDGQKIEDWQPVKADTSLFEAVNGENLWEPGHTEYVKLRIRNAGTLALKYKFNLDVYGDEDGGKEKQYTSVEFDKEKPTEHAKFYLSDYIVFNNIEDVSSVNVNDRSTFWNDSLEPGNFKDIAINDADGKDAWLEPKQTKEFYLAAYMPTTVGNEANQLTSARGVKNAEGIYENGEGEPKIYLGITLKAAQASYEKDSFDNTYDVDADYFDEAENPDEPVTPSPTPIKERPESGEIGAGNYILQAAINNDYNNTPITLTDGEAVIDLNGKEFGAINLTGGTGLTVKDSIGTGNFGRICFEGGGILLIESGKVKSITSKGTTAENRVTATINGGTITAPITAKYMTLTINGGNFICTDPINSGKILFSDMAKPGTNVIINDGTFDCGINWGSRTTPNTTLTINGGTYGSYEINVNYGTVNITGGTFNETVKVAQGSTATLNITGGKFKNNPSAYVDSEHTITNVDGYYVVTSNS